MQVNKTNFLNVSVLIGMLVYSVPTIYLPVDIISFTYTMRSYWGEVIGSDTSRDVLIGCKHIIIIVKRPGEWRAQYTIELYLWLIQNVWAFHRLIASVHYVTFLVSYHAKLIRTKLSYHFQMKIRIFNIFDFHFTQQSQLYIISYEDSHLWATY